MVLSVISSLRVGLRPGAFRRIDLKIKQIAGEGEAGQRNEQQRRKEDGGDHRHRQDQRPHRHGRRVGEHGADAGRHRADQRRAAVEKQRHRESRDVENDAGQHRAHRASPPVKAGHLGDVLRLAADHEAIDRCRIRHPDQKE